MDPTAPQTVDIQDIFKTQLKIEAKVMAIENLFANQRRTSKTDYKPSYQRNYVWDDDKATYFIESILLGTEIPPIIFFNSKDKIEVIDGRQRFETIKRFIEKDLKLRKGGLYKLSDLRNKNFDDLNELRDIFWDTKLRVIEFSFRDQSLASPEKEDLVKMEIFKRYNSGITPLRAVEIDKAKYQDNHINSYFKKKIQTDSNIREGLLSIFGFELPFDVEKVLRKIRQQLTISYIPIKYYSNVSAKQEVISRFFEYLTDTTTDIDEMYLSFSKKIDILITLKAYFVENNLEPNKLFFECLFWALSIIEREGLLPELILEEKNKHSLLCWFKSEISVYELGDSNLYNRIIIRYEATAAIIEKICGVNFDVYILSNEEFKEQNKKLARVLTNSTSLAKFESLRLNKPDASSTTVDDICTRMSKERFLVRPPYQRREVIDRTKSSAIIESILLGIKIPPIFLFKRQDGVAEVLDGQQRLLSILGFLGKPFIDDNRRTAYSEKNGYSLRKLNILKDVEGKTFNQLPTHYQDRILDSDLWIVEINEKSNISFDPIDLFIRLNYKPFPIMENTFEMWNSYVDREIISKIKQIYEKYKDWFYVRVDNRRMENESLVTYLCFLEFTKVVINSRIEAPNNFDIYRSSSKLNVRIVNKSQITNALDEVKNKTMFLISCQSLEDNFILKLKELLLRHNHDDDEMLKNELDQILGISKVRTFQNIYTLWYILLNMSVESVRRHKIDLRHEINSLIKGMRTQTDIKSFKNKVKALQNKYNK